MTALGHILPIPVRAPALPWRHAVLLAALLGALALGLAHPGLLGEMSALIAQTKSDPVLLGLVVLIYMVLIALPFVPGAELGLMLLALFGATLALPLYLATVVALTGAFVMGRMAAPRLRTGRRAGPEGATRAPATFPPAMDAHHAPWLKRLVRYRAVALILLINMPGNTVLGGGGGISFMAGLTRHVSLPGFMACVAVAVAPVPLMVMALPLLGDTAVALWIMEQLGEGLAGAGS
ncbi:hypothetical protein FHS89_000983 [Rubricella aquisinus]|uniref:TVP38/TMEM64 family membrane protein n=1 Tax=Rubricella aquisinus TaxID=2028108 RepID=A0A840X2T2_9RHOB|nr:hypothetical protein [Rubricella aquisinus]MBB5514977.1 hypothetical protein [Rubricella aquisinus]